LIAIEYGFKRDDDVLEDIKLTHLMPILIWATYRLTHQGHSTSR
jgi:hypothetical protein